MGNILLFPASDENCSDLILFWFYETAITILEIAFKFCMYNYLINFYYLHLFVYNQSLERVSINLDFFSNSRTNKLLGTNFVHNYCIFIYPVLFLNLCDVMLICLHLHDHMLRWTILNVYTVSVDLCILCTSKACYHVLFWSVWLPGCTTQLLEIWPDIISGQKSDCYVGRTIWELICSTLALETLTLDEPSSSVSVSKVKEICLTFL